jgi:hypothetical protein
MVLNRLLQLLMGHPQFGPRLIQTLADSWPIRRAARFTAYLYLRGKQAVEEQVKPGLEQYSKDHQLKIDPQRFGQNLRSEIRQKWEEAKQQADRDRLKK